MGDSVRARQCAAAFAGWNSIFASIARKDRKGQTMAASDERFTYRRFVSFGSDNDGDGFSAPTPDVGELVQVNVRMPRFFADRLDLLTLATGIGGGRRVSKGEVVAYAVEGWIDYLLKSDTSSLWDADQRTSRALAPSLRAPQEVLDRIATERRQKEELEAKSQ
jgi:hypothetical protein